MWREADSPIMTVGYPRRRRLVERQDAGWRWALSLFLVLVPALSALLGLISALLILRRFFGKGGTHLLFWGLGAVMYGIGSLCEALHGAFGWSPLVFRFWYLFGAVLVAAWLGQGTVFLLVRKPVAMSILGVLVAGSIYAAFRVFASELDPTLMGSSSQAAVELSGRAIVTPGVRLLTPFFNVYGTLALVGGALWSALALRRKRILPQRVVGATLVAVGAMLPALGGALSRARLPYVLYLGELAGIALILLGFLRATTPPSTGGGAPSPVS